ncbi:MAG: sigma factor-like helix-turn-helix DNA-binding protein [Minisyncoccia bacterium]
MTPTEKLEKGVTPHDVNHLGEPFFTPDHLNELMRTDRVKILESAMQKALEPIDERILRLYWGIGVEEKTAEEIGELIGLARPSVQQRIHKAQGTLQQWFVKHPQHRQTRDFSEFE